MSDIIAGLDVAISAPYEDGTGAVYIFMGSKDGPKLGDTISPKTFHPGIAISGFGFGLSGGKDVDNNGHNGEIHFISSG